MLVKEMTVNQWIAVPPNPHQCDTERNATTAEHLKSPLPVHWIVFAAQLPDGSLVKLDGHTRALMWQRNEIHRPMSLACHIIPVNTIEEATALYSTFDSQEALETVSDKISGAFGALKFKPESLLLCGGAIKTPIRLCWDVKHGNNPNTWSGGAKQFPIYDAVAEFSNELFMLDSYDLKPRDANAGVTAAFILTYRKYNADALSFWTPYFFHKGTKVDGKMDAVQALTEHVQASRGKMAGQTRTVDMCGRAVMAVERYMRGDLQRVNGLKSVDLTGYLDRPLHSAKSVPRRKIA